MGTRSTPITTAQVGTNAGEAPIESVPIDGTPPPAEDVTEQNALILVILPIVLLVVGTILYLVKRRPPGTDVPLPPGERGGLVLMAVGGGLTALMLIFLMIT